ncbi:MAG TPA: hypothetical protein PK874_04615 [Desulfobacteraceae bacterium]|nr:hypothetical protein [Desulfobacteraceae bacterium]HPJ67642.1 hypothetical protein [Desulfobacteraceae bacterium]HPQ29426.1 hypothetical protein [Desulfobacteraceae bacterium]
MTANRKKMQGVKFLLIVFASTVFAVLLHQVHHDPLMTVRTEPQSIIITSGYFPPVAFASLFVAFCIMGLMFLTIQKTLRGKKLLKSTLFGIALGGMYLVGMIEAYVVYPVPLFGELYTGLVDGCGILLMSLLLGKYMADDMPDEKRPSGATFPAILIIPVIYLLMRYFSYTVINIESSYSTLPAATFLWTAGMGCWVGVMYMLVGRNICPRNPFNQALVFGGLIFGINWLIYNLFTLIFLGVSVLDLLYRCIFDSLAVVMGVYVLSFLSREKAMPPSAD